MIPEHNKIYLEKCEGFMERCNPGVFSCIITSPPYNLKKKYSKYKDDIKRDKYVEWMGKVANLSEKVLTDDGSFFLNFGGRPTDPWLAWDVAREFGKHFDLQNVIHWIKRAALMSSLAIREM